MHYETHFFILIGLILLAFSVVVVILLRNWLRVDEITHMRFRDYKLQIVKSIGDEGVDIIEAYRQGIPAEDVIDEFYNRKYQL